MSNTRTLRTVKNNIITLDVSEPILTQHFSSPTHCTKNILDQFTEKLYDSWFENKNDLNILDCGGNIGLFALHVFECAKKIVSVEPTPNHIYIFKQLTSNYPNISLCEAALSPNDGEIDFYFCNDNTTMNSIANNYGSGNIKVKGKTLKTILDENNFDIVDFAKIDIEGSEILAITDKTISEVSERIKSFFVETHDTAYGRIPQNRDILSNIFKKYNYNVQYIGHDSLFAWK